MILYLHGLNSGNTSYKATVLREALNPIPVASPSYQAHRPERAVAELEALLRNLIEEQPRLMIVGSSLGGFYGQYLARQFEAAVYQLVLINPALRPWELLADHVGEQCNFVTGERYILTAEHIEQTRGFAIDDINDGIPTTLLLDKGDEVIDYRIAAEIYRDVGELFIFEGGDHGFQHMDEAIAIIRERYRQDTLT